MSRGPTSTSGRRPRSGVIRRGASLLLLLAGCVENLGLGEEAEGPGAAETRCATSLDCSTPGTWCGMARLCEPCSAQACDDLQRSCGQHPDCPAVNCGACEVGQECTAEGLCAVPEASLCAGAGGCEETVIGERRVSCGRCEDGLFCLAGRCTADPCATRRQNVPEFCGSLLTGDVEHSCGCPAQEDCRDPGDGVPRCCATSCEGEAAGADDGCGLPCRWVRRASGGPAARFGAGAGYLAAEERVVLFGGQDDSADGGTTASFGDLWSLGAGPAWTEEQPGGDVPGPRASGSLVSDGETLLYFGGWDGWNYPGADQCVYDELFALRRQDELLTWSRIDPGPLRPPPRFRAGLAATGGGELYVYGGRFEQRAGQSRCAADLAQSVIHADLWRFDGVAWSPLAPAGPTPGERLGPGLAHDPGRGKLVLFGGDSNAGSTLDDLWEYDLASGSWEERQLPPGAVRPGGRSDLAMVWLSGKIWLFGGARVDDLSWNDVWSWDGEAWEELVTSPAARPSPRRSFAATVAGDGSLLVFGGLCSGSDCPVPGETYLDDTWVLVLP